MWLKGKQTIGTDFFAQKMRIWQSTNTSRKRTLIVDMSEKQMSTTYLRRKESKKSRPTFAATGLSDRIFVLFILQNKFYNRPSQAPSAKPLTSKDLQKDTKTYGNIHLNDQTTLQFYFCFRFPKKNNCSKLWISTVYLQFSVKALLLALLDSSLSHDLRA